MTHYCLDKILFNKKKKEKPGNFRYRVIGLKEYL